jgi:hypothetical protein
LGVELAAAIEAFAAGDVMEHNDAISRGVALDAGPDGGDNTSGLMPVDTRSRKQVEGDLLQIGMADSAGFHANEDLTRADFGNRNGLDADDARPFVDGGVLRRWMGGG